MRGTIETWDEAAGHGVVAASDGRRFFFHCTQIADGSRTIEQGVAVRFDVVPGHLGTWEAAHVEKQ